MLSIPNKFPFLLRLSSEQILNTSIFHSCSVLLQNNQQFQLCIFSWEAEEGKNVMGDRSQPILRHILRKIVTAASLSMPALLSLF